MVLSELLCPSLRSTHFSVEEAVRVAGDSLPTNLHLSYYNLLSINNRVSSIILNHKSVGDSVRDVCDESRWLRQGHSHFTVVEVEGVGDQETILCAGGGNVHQAAFFLHVIQVFGCAEGWEPSVESGENEDAVPLQSFGTVDC